MTFSEVEEGFLQTNLGWLKLSYTSKGLREVQWVDEPPEKRPLPSELIELAELFELYFQGERVDFSQIKLDFARATPFKSKVYMVVSRIPYGEVRSYSWVAREVGRSRGARAVGQALAENKLLIVVPCHRVIRKDSSLGGWSGRPGFKEKLLRLEKADLVLKPYI